MEKIGSGFVYPSDSISVDAAMAFPQVHHYYGMSQPENTGPLFWMSYRVPGDVGTIKFLRRFGTTYPDVGRAVCEFLSSLVDYPFVNERVNLVWTRGHIPEHIDESGRACAINIGLRNSDTAYTIASRSKDEKAWRGHAITDRVQDGCAYLLDTGSMHEVVSRDPLADRILLTYAFQESYDQLKELVYKC